MRGLAAAYFAERVYMMSATFDAYQLKLLERVWDVHEQEIRHFKNLATISSGLKTNDFDLTYLTRKTEMELVNEILTKVRKEFDKQPFIIFMAREDDCLLK